MFILCRMSLHSEVNVNIYIYLVGTVTSTILNKIGFEGFLNEDTRFVERSWSVPGSCWS